MKKIIAVLLSLLMITVLFAACSDSDEAQTDATVAASGESAEQQDGGAAADTNNDAGSNANAGSNEASPAQDSSQQGGQGGEAVSATEKQPGTFVDASVALQSFAKPAPEGVQNNVADPSGNMRFVYDETGRIVKCYYTANGQEVYLNYRYDDMGWVQIYGFIGETVVADEVIKLNGAYNPDVGYSICNGYYFKGYTF